MTKPEMMPRTAYTAPHTERFAGGGGGASASLALLSGAARAFRSTFASDAPTNSTATHTVGLASNSTVPPIILSGDRPPTEKRPRRNGAIRPIAVPTARAALMGSRTQLPTASAGFGAGAPLSAASIVRRRWAPM